MRGSKCTFWRSVLSDRTSYLPSHGSRYSRLNAPFGARCFLNDQIPDDVVLAIDRLNASFGVRCFLTRKVGGFVETNTRVLMRLLALGAF